MTLFLRPEKGGFSFDSPLTRGRGRQRLLALHGQGRDISFQKEISLPYTLPEKIPIASEQLEELQCLPIVLPCARPCRVSIARRFASAPIIRCCAAVGGSAALRMRHTPCGCRSADLVEVRTNFRLLGHSSMRRAQQCRIPQAVCRRATVTRASR